MKQQLTTSMKKYFYGYVAVCGLLLSALPTMTQAQQLGPNLVKNGSFEDGATHWNVPANTAEIVDDVAYSGTQSLYYSNTNAKQYKMFSQKVDAKPGETVVFSAWVKGKDVEGEKSTEGAGLYMQSYEGDKYVSGSFPGTAKGTFDWKKISGRYLVPENATSVSIGLYLRKGVTGLAWFDDVEVNVERPLSFSSYLLYPNYRGMMTREDNSPWKFRVNIHPQPDWKNGSVKILNTLTDSTGKVLLQKSQEVPSTRESVEVTLDAPRGLALGNYTLSQTIIDPNGKEDYQRSHTIRVVQQMPKVYVDAQGFTVVDGKRFFPLGVYLGPTSEEDLARISAGGFNTILTYGYGSGKDPEAYMERAHKNNLKVVYSLKDMYPGKHGYGDEAFDVAEKYVRMMRDNPALLAWYTNDELDTNWMDKLEKSYNLVTELDPQHPTFQVLYQMDIVRKYFYVTDILATDPYPVGSADLTRTSADARITRAATQGAQGMWMVPQMMDWGIYRKERESHPPSLDEMRNQAYQTIINGATGLIWYSYYDLMYEKYPRGEDTKNMELFHKRWKDAAAMAEEINAITPVVLANDKVALNLAGEADIEAAAWKDGDSVLLMLANPYYEEKSITFELPKGWKIADANQGQIKSTFANGKATFTLPSVGSGVFRLAKN